MAQRLTDKMEAYSLERARGKSQIEAYTIAYKPVTTNENSRHRKAYQTEHHPLVQARIAELRKPIVEKAQLDLQTHLEELQRLKQLAEDNGKIEAAIKAEKHRGEASGLYVSKVDAKVEGNVTVEIVRFGDK